MPGHEHFPFNTTESILPNEYNGFSNVTETDPLASSYRLLIRLFLRNYFNHVYK